MPDDVSRMEEFPGYYPVGKSVEMFNCRVTLPQPIPEGYVGHAIRQAEMRICRELEEQGLFIQTELRGKDGTVREIVLSLPVANFRDEKERRNYVNSAIRLQSLNAKLVEENKRYRAALKSVRDYCSDNANIVIDHALSGE